MKLHYHFFQLIICILNSLFLTRLIDRLTINTNLQFIFIFLYFMLISIIICIIYNKVYKRKEIISRNSKILFISLVLGVGITISFSDEIIDNSKETSVIIKSNLDSTNFTEKQSIWISDIIIDGKNTSLKDYIITDGWVYHNEWDDIMSIVGNPEPLTLHFPKSKNIQILFAYYNDFVESTLIKDGIESDYKKIQLEKYDNDTYLYEVQSNIQIDYSTNIIDIFLGFVFISTILYLLIIILLKYKFTPNDYMDKDSSKKILFIYAISLFLIVFNFYNRIYRSRQDNILNVFILYFITYYKFFNVYKNKIMIKYKNLKCIILFFITTLYISFSLFGDNIFLPIGKVSIDLKDAIIFIFLSISIIPFCFMILYIFELIREKRFFYEKTCSEFYSKNVSNKFKAIAYFFSGVYVIILSNPLFKLISYYVKSKLIVIIFCIIINLFTFLIMNKVLISIRYFIIEKKYNTKKIFLIFNIWNLLIEGLVLIIFNPGLMSPDSFDQYLQAHNIIALSDHHPVAHTLIEKLLYGVWDSPFCIALMQIVFYSIIISTIAILLYKKGYNKKLLIFYVILNSLMVNNSINLITLWKDIAFSITLLWLTLICFKLVIEKNKFYNKISNIIQFIIALCFSTLFRHNGIIVFVGLIALLLIQVFIIKSIKPLIICLFSLLIIVGIKGPLFKNLDVAPNGAIASIIPIHGLAYLNYEGEYLNEDCKEYLKSYMPLDIMRELYTPYSANSFMFTDVSISYNAMGKYRVADLNEVVTLYLKSFYDNPYLIIKDRLFGTDLVWNVFQGNGYNYRYTNLEGIRNNDYNIIHVENNYADLYFNVMGYIVNNKIIDSFVWRVGFYIDLLLLIIVYLVANRKKVLIICMLPIIFNTLSLYISMAWQDYRYVYYIFLCFGAILLFTFYDDKELSTGGKNEL